MELFDVSVTISNRLLSLKNQKPKLLRNMYMWNVIASEKGRMKSLLWIFRGRLWWKFFQDWQSNQFFDVRLFANAGIIFWIPTLYLLRCIKQDHVISPAFCFRVMTLLLQFLNLKEIMITILACEIDLLCWVLSFTSLDINIDLVIVLIEQSWN